VKRALAIVVIVLLAAFGALARTFSPLVFEVPPLVIDALPAASPPEGMSLSAIPTGAMESRAAFAFRGGDFGEKRDFPMTPILIRHPKGNLLIDAGFGRDIDAHVTGLGGMMKALTTYRKGTAAAEQLEANGLHVKDLAGVLITHSHWDHVSGLDSLEGIPVWMNEAEEDFVASGTPHAALFRSFGKLATRRYELDGGPYLGFPRSHDVWSDGSIVVVPAPGHTPGSVVVFVALPSGARYALLGDLVWQMEGIDIPTERPWLARSMINENREQVRESVVRVAAIHRRFPEMHIVPAHDAGVAAMLPIFPAAAR
jgi:glyoxylase-like metal-dependent hydrolase (beta-lactamase superfamily II)